MTGAEPLWNVADQLAPGRAALLIIDLQNDFTHPDGHLARRKGVDVTPVRNRFATVTRLVTQARRGGVPVIWLSVVHDVVSEPANYLAAQLAKPPGLVVASPPPLALAVGQLVWLREQELGEVTSEGSVRGLVRGDAVPLSFDACAQSVLPWRPPRQGTWRSRWGGRTRACSFTAGRPTRCIRGTYTCCTLTT